MMTGRQDIDDLQTPENSPPRGEYTRFGVRIDAEAVRKRIGFLGLKQWWIAEQIGVDRKTVSRWLTGKVRFIQPFNLDKLAAILSCPPTELIEKALPEDTEGFKDDVAQAILEENLQATLAPAGKWQLLERLIKAGIRPDTPPATLGRLYNRLAIACWRSERLEEAWKYARKADQIADSTNSMTIKVVAQYNKATILSFQGWVRKALERFSFCIENKAHLDNAIPFGGILCNTAICYHQYGDLDKSLAVQRQAIAELEHNHEEMRKSIAWCSLGIVLSESRRFDKSLAAFERSLQYAHAANYVRGKHACAVYMADVLALQGNLASAREYYERGMQGFREIQLDEILNFEVGIRLCRLEGRHAEAQRIFEQALPLAGKFQLEQAALYVENARLPHTSLSPLQARKSLEAAAAIYARCEAKIRHKNILALLVAMST